MALFAIDKNATTNTNRIMDNTANPQNEQSNDNRPSEENPGRLATLQQPPGKTAFESFRSAFRQGAEDARDAAERAIPHIKSAAADATYWMAYGVSFAAVFQWTVIRNLAPESLKSGCRDGVKAGKESADQWIEKLKQTKESPVASPAAEAGPSGETTQPSPA